MKSTIKKDPNTKKNLKGGQHLPLRSIKNRCWSIPVTENRFGSVNIIRHIVCDINKIYVYFY